MRRTRKDEPIDCPFCGLSWAEALTGGITPAMKTGGDTPADSWVRCSCTGGKEVNLAEELMRLKESDGKRLARMIRECHWEDTQGRLNRDQLSDRSESKGRSDKGPVKKRVEDAWEPRPTAELVASERINRQSVPINVNVPRFVKNKIASQVSSNPGWTESSLMCWIISQGLASACGVKKVPYGTVRRQLRFYLSPGEARVWRAAREAHGVSDADLVTHLVARHYATRKAED